MPEPRRIVISNATPLIGLALIKHLPLLYALYNEVLVPPAVYTEVLTDGPGRPGSIELQRATWIQRTPLQDPRRADLLSDLDRGEAEVLALAQELHADLVIIDERLGRRHAKRLGLTMTGTLGILLRAKAQGHIAEIKPWIDQLQQGGIYLSEFLVREALQLAKE